MVRRDSCLGTSLNLYNEVPLATSEFFYEGF